jgi:hypothetical protein
MEGQTAIRKFMQKLLGIKYDHLIGEAVRQGHSTPLHLTAKAKPSLTPFCPCWDDLKSEWNQALEELFVERFKVVHPELRENEACMRAYFHQRLRTLREALSRHNRELAGDNICERRSSKSRRRERRRMVRVLFLKSVYRVISLDRFTIRDGHGLWITVEPSRHQMNHIQSYFCIKWSNYWELTG